MTFRVGLGGVRWGWDVNVRPAPKNVGNARNKTLLQDFVDKRIAEAYLVKAQWGIGQMWPIQWELHRKPSQRDFM